MITSLDDNIKRLKSRAFAVGTLRNRLSCLVRFNKFCNEIHADAQPPSPVTIQRYVARLSSCGLRYSTVRAHLGAIRHYLLRHDYDAGILDGYQIRILLRGLKSAPRPKRRRKPALTTDQLRDVLRACDEHPHGPLIRLVIVMSLLLYIRQSNFAGRTMAEFDPHKHFIAEDVFLDITQGCLLVHVKWSKVNQTGESYVYRLGVIPFSPFCPVSAYEKYIDYLEIDDFTGEPLMMTNDEGDLQQVSTGLLRRFFAEVTGAAGLPRNKFTLHSLRRTGATLGESESLSDSEIKEQGGWGSEAFLEYVGEYRRIATGINTTMIRALVKD